MYGWIWHRLPFGLPGKIIGSLGLFAATAALLWFVVFPWVEPLMPFDDVQVTEEGSTPGDSIETSADPSVDDENAIPYSTHQNDPVPSATSRSR
jgi:hypothetical protein